MPFENFTNWWQQLPGNRRDAILSAAEKQGMLKPAPTQITALWVQGEAFQGGDWKPAQTDGRTVLQHGGGHGGSAATVVVDIPEAGSYRLWSRWWNLPGSHNSFQVRVRPLAVADFQYGWQQGVEGDYLDHRFAWSWFQRKVSTPVSYEADKKGFQWESSPLFDLPQGEVLISLAPMTSGGPFTPRNVDSFLLTQDPLFVPGETDFADSKPDDAKWLIATQQQTTKATPDQRRLWNIRPGAVPLSSAPAEVAGVWREWRDAFIGRLAEGKGLSNAEQAAAEKTYFDERWNLVGTPAMVKEQAAQLQSAKTVVPGFIHWIEAEDFKTDKGWEITTLQGMGLNYEDWVWEISDEPSPSAAPKWIAAAKDIKAVDPKIRIWVNPGEKQVGAPQAIADMSRYIDVYCPYIDHWNEKDAGYQKLLQTLGDTKLLYTTPCLEEKSPQAPLEMLSLAKASLQHQRDGWDAFALRNYYSYAASAWDEVNAPFVDQAVSMYPGAWDQVIGPRNLEAVRVAVQRWKTAQVGD